MVRWVTMAIRVPDHTLSRLDSPRFPRIQTNLALIQTSSPFTLLHTSRRHKAIRVILMQDNLQQWVPDPQQLLTRRHHLSSLHPRLPTLLSITTISRAHHRPRRRIPIFQTQLPTHRTLILPPQTPQLMLHRSQQLEALLRNNPISSSEY